jgi:hypothetical protein
MMYRQEGPAADSRGMVDVEPMQYIEPAAAALKSSS